MSFAALKTPGHRKLHPFGQIPTYEDGEVVLFESGAIVLHIAMNHAGLLPADPAARARAEVLGGEIVGVFRNSDAPDVESRMPGGDDMVMNMSMRLGSATVMASDNPDDMYDRPQGFRVSVSPPSHEEFDRIHAALAQDAQVVEMEPGETFWAERFAMFTDRFGTPWMLNYEGNKAQS